MTAAVPLATGHLLLPEHAALVSRAAAAAVPLLDEGPSCTLRVYPGGVEVWLRPGRPVSPREAVLECGMVLFNARLALARLDVRAGVRIVPRPSEPDLAAVIGVASGSGAPAQTGLYEAMWRQRTYVRRGCGRAAVRSHVVGDLENAARTEGGWLREVHGPEARDFLLDLSAQAAGVLMAERGGGVVGDDVVTETYSTAPEGPRMIVVGGHGDSPPMLLRAGQALQRVLLTAVSRGLVAVPFTQVPRVPELRAALVEELRLPGSPQTVWLIGHAA